MPRPHTSCVIRRPRSARPTCGDIQRSQALTYDDGMISRALPGAELVEQGLADLRDGRESIASVLVSIGATRLTAAGYDVVHPFDEAEHRLYELLSRNDPNSAHSRYNALIRRLVSFERAAECVAP